MGIYDFSSLRAYTICLFLLVLCIYRRHIRRRRLFPYGLGLFMGELLLGDVATNLLSRLRLSGVRSASFVLGHCLVYVSLSVFVVACMGSRRVFAQCSRCGYDLTGNHSGVCPECGGNLRQEGDRPRAASHDRPASANRQDDQQPDPPG